MNSSLQNLTSSLIECNRHFIRLFSAYAALNKIIPLNVKKYELLSESEVAKLDQFLFRFSKIQDTIGQRVFPYLLLSLEEDIKPLAFIDIINRVEELLSFELKDEWLLLRKLRNDVAHEYSEDSEKNIASINIMFEKSKFLFDLYNKIKEYSLNRFGEMKKEIEKASDLKFPISTP